MTTCREAMSTVGIMLRLNRAFLLKKEFCRRKRKSDRALSSFPWIGSPQSDTYNVTTKRLLSSASPFVASSYPEIEIPDAPLHEFIFQNLHRWEDKTAVECGFSGKKITYRDLVRYSTGLANSLIKVFKLEKGDLVAVILPNCPEYSIAILAASISGVVVTTINFSYTPVEIRLQLKDTNPKLIITERDIYSKCVEALNIAKTTIPIAIVRTHKSSDIPPGAVSFEELAEPLASRHAATFPVAAMNDVVVLPYSSGTSGLPKGVELTHRNVVANLLQFRLSHEMKANPDKSTGQCSILGVLPMFHIYGMATVMLDAISEGGRLISLHKFDPRLFLDAIVSKKTQILYLVPPLVFFLGDSSAVKPVHLDGVEHVVVGAAPCGEKDLKKLLRKFTHLRITQGYGMTETSPVITITHKDRAQKMSSVGHPLPSTIVKVADVDGGAPLLAGRSGEIRVKGPQVMKGYFRRDEETKNAFDDEGWLKTGDIGYFDDENDFYVVDRMKELIKVKGFQVAPAELEEFIRNHPKVSDVGVIGIGHPLYGEVPKAFVVVKEGVSCTEEEILNYVKENLSGHKHLFGGVEFLKEIPKSNSGKILRKNLRKLHDKKREGEGGEGGKQGLP